MRARPESGFLLIGVIMFVLALTILGMSLYALSSYEAEFQMNSRDSGEALYRAEGGIQMVLKLLKLNWKFNDAQLAVTHAGVDSVYVSQPGPGGTTVTMGTLNDNVVTVTVVAHEHNSSRKVTTRFLPQHQNNFYERLFTVGGGGLSVELNGSASFSVTSPDSVWTNDPDIGAAGAWSNLLLWPLGQLIKLHGVPPPDVATYTAAHLAECVPPENYSPASHSITLNPPSGFGYYYQASSPPSDYTYNETTVNTLTLNVGGTAVWILPGGLRAFGDVKIQRASGASSATLVIVASPMVPARSLDPDFGLKFFGGLGVSGVNVILVTDGCLDLEQQNNGGVQFDAPTVSMYCTRIHLLGPVSPKVSNLAYDPAMTPVIQQLEQSGVLPRGVGSTASSFAFAKGSWRDVTP